MSLEKLLFEDEYETKNGEEINFEWTEQAESGRQTYGGFYTVHMLEAFLNNEEVGYIKVTYVKKEDFENYIPTIFHYLDNIMGKSLLDNESRDSNGWKWDFPDKRTFLTSLYSYSRSYPPRKIRDISGTREIKNQFSEEEVDKYLEEYIERYKNYYNDILENWKTYWLEKPHVDYIKVERDHRRKGVGFALYKKMAKELGKRGKVLCSSSLQSDKAKAAWEKLKEVLPVQKNNYKNTASGEEKTRYCIDFT